MAFWSDMLGRRPKVPEVTRVDLGQQQQKAIEENIAAAPGAAKLAQLSQDQIRRMMEQAIPGFEGIVGKASGNINDLLAGKIPTDVSDAVQRNSATRSLVGGYSGTEAARNLVARDLGLTSLDLTQQGLKSADAWIRSMEQLYSPSEAIFTGMFVTPQQQYAVTREEENLQFQKQWLAEQIDAMPSPWAAALKEAVLAAISIYSHTPGKESPYARPSDPGGTAVAGNNRRESNGINWSSESWSSDSGLSWSGSQGSGGVPANTMTSPWASSNFGGGYG